MDKVQAFVNYWQRFGIPAYDITNVPDGAVMPYITYEVITDSFGGEVALTNSLYYFSTSWADITRKAQEIADYIGMGGTIVNYDEGAFWIKRQSPFSQRLETDKQNVKRIVLNFSVEFLSEN